MSQPTPAQETIPFDPALLANADADPLMIGIYAAGFLIAVVWNLYAYYKLFTLDHVKEELKLKKEMRSRGLLDEDED